MSGLSAGANSFVPGGGGGGGGGRGRGNNQQQQQPGGAPYGQYYGQPYNQQGNQQYGGYPQQYGNQGYYGAPPQGQGPPGQGPQGGYGGYPYQQYGGQGGYQGGYQQGPGGYGGPQQPQQPFVPPQILKRPSGPSSQQPTPSQTNVAAPPSGPSSQPQASWEDEVDGAEANEQQSSRTPADLPKKPAPSGPSSTTANTVTPKTDEKPKVISISLSSSKPSAPTSTSSTANSSAAPTPKSTTTPTTSKPGTPNPEKQAAKAAAASSSKPAAEASTASKKKEEAAEKKAAAEKAEKIAADAVLEDQKNTVDEATFQELYGDSEGPAKSHLNLVFIGHVDAGKSTMGGNILFLTGMVDKRTMEKYEREAKEQGRESWYLSWALDSTTQERAKGKTVEVGRAYFETEKRRYTILDAPGHKNYVPQMISGASQADVAILVISARKGEFEAGFEKGGQTREHTMLAKTAGISKLIVAVNKMDEPTVNWDKERFDEIVKKITPFLKGSGFAPNTITFMPVSGYTGANIIEAVDKKVAPWVTTPPLLKFLDEMPLVDRKIHEPLMMPISEKYKDMGTIIVGKVESGKVRKGQTLLLMPNKTNVEVAAIYNEIEEEINEAFCGDNVRVRIKETEGDDDSISVGFVLTDPKKPVHAVSTFQAELIIWESKNIICSGYQAVMHVHTLTEEIELAALLHYFDKKTGRKSKKPPSFATKGQKIIALIRSAKPICVEKFSDHPQLGRFTLRDEGKTIAIGKITKLVLDDLPEVEKLAIGGPAAVNGV